MPEYLVTWTIEVTADSPREAAQQALDIHRDPTSLATVFEVLSEDGTKVLVDVEGVLADGD